VLTKNLSSPLALCLQASVVDIGDGETFTAKLRRRLSPGNWFGRKLQFGGFGSDFDLGTDNDFDIPGVDSGDNDFDLPGVDSGDNDFDIPGIGDSGDVSGDSLDVSGDSLDVSASGDSIDGERGCVASLE